MNISTPPSASPSANRLCIGSTIFFWMSADMALPLTACSSGRCRSRRWLGHHDCTDKVRVSRREKQRGQRAVGMANDVDPAQPEPGYERGQVVGVGDRGIACRRRVFVRRVIAAAVGDGAILPGKRAELRVPVTVVAE